VYPSNRATLNSFGPIRPHVGGIPSVGKADEERQDVANLDSLIAITSSAVGTLVTQVVLTRLLARLQVSRGRARRDFATREFILEYSKSFRRFPLPFAAFWAVFFVMVVALVGAPTWDDLPGVLMAFFGIAIPLIVATVEAHGVEHRIGRDGITRHSPWSGELFVRWGEITNVTYRASAQWIVVHSPRGKVRISEYLSGLPSLARGIMDNVPQEKWEGVRDVLDRMVRPLPQA